MGTPNPTRDLPSLWRVRIYQFHEGLRSRKSAASPVLTFSTEVENLGKPVFSWGFCTLVRAKKTSTATPGNRQPPPYTKDRWKGPRLVRKIPCYFSSVSRSKSDLNSSHVLRVSVYWRWNKGFSLHLATTFAARSWYFMWRIFPTRGSLRCLLVRCFSGI